MLKLYILRHAKSSWALPGKADFDRQLSPRGTKDLSKISRHMQEHSYLPDQIYVSPSVRTRLTIEGINCNIKEADLPIQYVDKLYLGSLDHYLDILRSHPNPSHSLMLVGHNPTCERLANLLVKDGTSKGLTDLSRKFPTGALATIDIKANKWSDIGNKVGYLHDFALPREL